MFIFKIFHNKLFYNLLVLLKKYCMNKPLLCIIIFSVFLQSCYLSRNVEGTCTMRIEFRETPLIGRPSSSKYIDYASAEEYKKLFMEGLEEELVQMGVTLTEDAQSEFVLLITEFSLKETISSSTVDDSSSPYNGQTYQLHSCDADAEYTLYRNGKKVSSGWAGVSKEEKLTNNRNVGDYILGSNKDNTEYRHKGLDESVFSDLAKKCGRRTAARITKKVTKAMK